MSSFSQFFGGGGGGFDITKHSATGFAKPSIILFDTRAGTRNFVVPEGVTKIRASVVGAGGRGQNEPGGGGGGYSEREYFVSGGDTISYTVGASPAGTSSFAGPQQTITATGGQNGAGSGGSGSGGTINSSGGAGGSFRGGGSSGHRHGNGFQSISPGGGGWGDGGGIFDGGGSSGGFDGWGLGLVPGSAQPKAEGTSATSNHSTQMSGYGCGGSDGSPGANGGMGGGGGTRANGGIGGGGGRSVSGNTTLGGWGLVLVEVLETA